MADDDSMYNNNATSGLYSAVAIVIFIMVTIGLLFPLNVLMPVDRRTICTLGAVLVFVSHTFLFPDKEYELIDGVDFEVIILLAGIMCINFMLVKQPETIKLVKDIQHLIKEHPRKGFWAVGGAAFFLSPFLTNDGVCLLFVAPVMSAFTSLDDSTIMDPSDPNLITIDTIKLKSTDALFFCLNIACSSNIGSALTYIGNPQNMIVAQDAIGVMPPYMFLGYMLIPSVFAFFATSLYLERCWVLSRREDAIKAQDTLGGAFEGTEEAESPLMKQLAKDQGLNGPVEDAGRIFTPMSPKKRSSRTGSAVAGIEQGGLGDADADEAPQNRFHYSEYWLQGPFPYSIVALTVVMIICIFFEVMSIAGIIAVFAVLMCIFVVFTNYWRNSQVLVDTLDGPQLVPLTREQKVENSNFFFEEMFASIDLNILLIFIGLFVVVDNLDSTGIPKAIWAGIVGKKPFRSTASVVGISIFVLIACQFVGNVPIIQLAKPNCESLDDGAKRYAWAILSFVATVGGNLTLTGSAANLIVAEQVMRIPGGPSLDFWKHFECCFVVTLLSITVGAAIITMTVIVDASLSGYDD